MIFCFTITIAKITQTLTGFAYSPATITFGDATPTLTPPTSNLVGATITYATASANCLVDSGTGALTISGGGDCEVTEFTVAGLPDNAAGEMYTFAVRSVNEAGQSDTVAEIMAAVIPTFTEWMVLLLSLAMMAYLFRRRMSGIVSGAFKKVAS